MPKEIADVIVVGAGVAGLAAARALCQKGLTATVLEARSRIGGRILTEQDSPTSTPVELGAEFIHGKSEEIWRIVRAAGLAVYEVPDNHWHFQNGVLKRRDDFWAEWEEIVEQMSRAERDQTFKEFIERRYPNAEQREFKSLAISYVEGFHAASIDRIGVGALLRSEQSAKEIEEEKQFRLLDGYHAIAEWLRAGLDPEQVSLHLNTVVKEIRWSRAKVEVHAQSQPGSHLEPFAARRAVVTLPLGVLQAPEREPGAVRFVPDLPDKRKAIDRLAMGSVVKIVLRFREQFWEDKNIRVKRKGGDPSQVSFIHSRDENFPTWWTALPVHAAVLTGWAGGPAAEKLALQEESSILGRAIETLAHIFGLERARIEGLLESWRLHNWQADPFTRGAYSYVPVNSLDAQRELAEPVEDTLFFAGEATSLDGQNGTVHGAIASGKRAAHEVVQSLGQNNLK
ncbi:MAG TPA: NAD(P)/FAD-dependent oxidoreductase [Blastocatellia bacterium]|nr:NAD(P)/FAD-dependent oxidoreductase [Blastocatellia bacterium]